MSRPRIPAPLGRDPISKLAKLNRRVTDLEARMQLALTRDTGGGGGVTAPLTLTLGDAAALMVRSGAAGDFASMNVGRTAAEGSLSVAAGAGEFATDAVAGDAILRAESALASLRLTAGGSPTMLRVQSTGLAAGGPLAMNSNQISGLPGSSSAGQAVRHEQLSGKADTVHTHAESDVTNLVTDLAAKQPLDADLTAIAALSTTAFGRDFLTRADAAAGRTYLGLGGAATLNVGTTAGTVAAGDDSRMTNARTPTAHASTHGSVGSDPITLAQSQVTNLTTDLAAKLDASALTTKGDLLTRDNSAYARLAAGSDGQALVADSAAGKGLKYAEPRNAAFRNVQERMGYIAPATNAAAAYLLNEEYAAAAAATGNAGYRAFYVNPDDYASVSGKARFKLRASGRLHGTAQPGQSVTMHLYPITTPAMNGTSLAFSALGASVLSVPAITLTTASRMQTAISAAEVSLSAGHYVIGFVTSGATAANSAMAFDAQLLVREIA